MSRITPETMTLGILAVLFGLAGAFTVRWYLHQEPPAEIAAPALVTIPMASNDLPPGKTLALGDITIQQFTREQIAEREIPTELAMTNPDQIIGRVLKSALKPGQPFLTTNLYPVGTGPSLAHRLKPGFRAVTIAVGGSGNLDGFAAPESIVDVLFRTVNDPRNPSARPLPEATYTLIEGVEVLALGNATTPGTNGSESVNRVTLAVTPQQAAALKAVEGRGELSLALRPDHSTVAGIRPARVTLDELLGIEPAPQPFVTEIYRGGSRQTVVFNRDTVMEESFGGMDSLLLSGPVRRSERRPAQPPAAPEETPGS